MGCLILMIFAFAGGAWLMWALLEPLPHDSSRCLCCTTSRTFQTLNDFDQISMLARRRMLEAALDEETDHDRRA